MSPTRSLVAGLLLALPLISVAPSEAQAKRIEQACLNSDRSRSTRPLCGCIQRVADQLLTRSDQKLAAKFFDDPQMAQDIRQSDSKRHEDFWRRYKDFGYTAQKICR